MNNFITKAALAAVVAISALGATSQAHANTVVVVKPAPKVIIRKPVVVVKPRVVVVKPRVVVVKPAPVVVMKPMPIRGRCAPGLALQKASNQGLNKVAISNSGPNRVVVTGKVRGVWTKIAFANVNGCPRL